jgi:hypothetical protein
MQQVFDRAEPADDEIEVGRGAGEKPGGDAARQRARRQVLRSARPCQQGARKCMRQRVQRDLPFRSI